MHIRSPMWGCVYLPVTMVLVCSAEPEPYGPDGRSSEDEGVRISLALFASTLLEFS